MLAQRSCGEPVLSIGDGGGDNSGGGAVSTGGSEGARDVHH